MCAGLVLSVRVLVHGVDKREVNCLSTVVLFQAAWYEPSFFDGCSVLLEPDMGELSHSLCRLFSATRNSAASGLQNAIGLPGFSKRSKCFRQ